MTVTHQAFKQSLAQFASGVTVVTTMHAGHRQGLTVSAFNSVSLSPPLVSICVDCKLDVHAAICASGVFAVNLLAQQQLQYGMRFAGMVAGLTDRFEGIDTLTAITGSPLLPNTLAWLDCRVWQVYAGGDHSIIVGEVLATECGAGLAPLIYHNRNWGRIAAIDAGKVAPPRSPGAVTEN